MADHRDPARDFERVLDDDPRRRRERDRRRYGPTRGPGTWIWWAIAIAGLVLFGVLVRAVMQKTRWTDAALDAPHAAVAAGCGVARRSDARPAAAA